MSDWSGEGYDAEASQGGGLFLRLKQKGEKVRLRMVSAPYRYTDNFEDRTTGETTQRRKVAWLAILKEVVNGQPAKRAVVFVNGPMVYGILKDLSENPDWGDPRTFDVTVERTEESGKYYVVTPLPKPIGPITEDEKALVSDANIDWPNILFKGRGNARMAGDDAPDPDDPFAGE